MKITSEIIQKNLIVLEKAKKFFPKLSTYQSLRESTFLLDKEGKRFSSEYYEIESKLNLIREEFRIYKINSYIDFIDYIYDSKKFEQEIFYSKKIKNTEFQDLLTKYSIDDVVKKPFSKMTKSTFSKFINSKRWDLFSGDYRPRTSKKRYADNMFRVSALIANYCIQNEIEVQESNRIRSWYRNLLPEPNLQIKNEIEKTKSIIDFIIEKFKSNDSDFKKLNLDHLMDSIKSELKSRMLSIDKNEQIKCIDVTEFEINQLTLGKVYQVKDLKIDSGILKVSIKNDQDMDRFYFYRQFESVKDLRNNFLDELLGDE